MKTKKLLTFVALSFIALLVLITCKKDDFNEVVGLCPQPKIEFTVTLSSNPVLGGTTIGNGTFPKDTLVTVAATPSAGYTFTNWTEGVVIASTSSSFTFNLDTNKIFVANFSPVVIGNFAVVLSSSPLAGGTTIGSGSFLAGSSVTIGATPNAEYTFVNWTKGATIISALSSYTFKLTKDTAFVANFLIKTYTLNVTAVNGSVAKNPDQPTYNSGSSVILTPTPALGYVFDSWSVDTTGIANPLTVLMNKNKNITANFKLVSLRTKYTLTTTGINGIVAKFPDSLSYTLNSIVQITAIPDAGYQFDSWSVDTTGSVNPLNIKMNKNKTITANFSAIVVINNCTPAVDLRASGNYVILSETGISTTGTTSVKGDMGISSYGSTSITGDWALQLVGTYSTSNRVIGKVYAADYTEPTPSLLSTAVTNMSTAFTEANGLAPSSAANIELGSGTLSGNTLYTGVYKWGTDLNITTDITLDGGGDNCAQFVFQIAGFLKVSNGVQIKLQNGAQAKNIFWVVAGSYADLGTTSIFNGNILSYGYIAVKTGGKVTGRLLSQTAVTLDAATIVKP